MQASPRLVEDNNGWGLVLMHHMLGCINFYLSDLSKMTSKPK